MVLARRSVHAPNNMPLNSSDSNPQFISRRASRVRRCSQPNSLGDAVKHQRSSQSGNLSRKLFHRLSINQCPWAYPPRSNYIRNVEVEWHISPLRNYGLYCIAATPSPLLFIRCSNKYTRPDFISLTWFWWLSQFSIQNLSRHFESSGEHDLKGIQELEAEFLKIGCSNVPISDVQLHAALDVLNSRCWWTKWALALVPTLNN